MALEESLMDNITVPWRHTFDHSDDEDDNLCDSKDLFYTTNTGHFEPANILICCIGSLPCHYGRSFLLSNESKPACMIKSQCANKVLPKFSGVPKSDKLDLSEVHSQADLGRHVLLHPKELELSATMTWAKTVLNLCKPKIVVVLSSQPLLEHFSSDHSSSSSSSSPFLRFLASSTWKEDHLPACPLLDAPNFLQGEAGALLTICEHSQLEGLALVCYSSRSDYGESVKLFSVGGLTQSYLKMGRPAPSDADLSGSIRRDTAANSDTLVSLFS